MNYLRTQMINFVWDNKFKRSYKKLIKLNPNYKPFIFEKFEIFSNNPFSSELPSTSHNNQNCKNFQTMCPLLFTNQKDDNYVEMYGTVFANYYPRLFVRVRIYKNSCFISIFIIQIKFFNHIGDVKQLQKTKMTPNSHNFGEFEYLILVNSIISTKQNIAKKTGFFASL